MAAIESNASAIDRLEPTNCRSACPSSARFKTFNHDRLRLTDVYRNSIHAIPFRAEIG